MKNVILASTSTLYGEAYLTYLKEEITSLFNNVSELIFIPFARPGGISYELYMQNVSNFFALLNIRVKGLHDFQDPAEAINMAQGIFTGGGNTFLLVKTLHELGVMKILKETIENGTPYLGTSAGSNIGGVTMQTTNDMPIVYPPDFKTMGLVPFNINAHYLDPVPGSKHNGETRETRIREFHVFNDIPVVGLREGSWIRVKGNNISTEGKYTSKIFLPNKEAFELMPGAAIDLGKHGSEG
ncbi:dipeptidase PepE [Olivibacter sp. SDN3]|uniref:dipeptidase PepE n=1 Tax=Olivibacter sp. SDN3 TaxID=2764720 RepID=UPI0016512EE8|nr:dipeptidase PepE [Olivibacter sp. SDN3]QNL48269.1 dipeptidase PepE [Olivibacter sp. SDN3]